MKKLLLVDGNSMLFRAYYATAYSGAKMSTSNGIPTNAIFGFASMFQKALDTVQPDALMVAFDAGKHTFRHDLYEDYKGGRQPAPDDLVPQFQLVRDMLDAFHVFWIERADIEADDLIGTVSKIAKEYHTTVLTSDKDLLQLIDHDTDVLLMKKGISELGIMDEETLKAEMGVTPPQVIDLKGLMGDKSDNIPGIPGVGEKTALKLLDQYGTVENVLEHSDELKGALQKKVVEGADSALLSKQLATIKTDVDLDFGLDALTFEPDYPGIVEFLQGLEMNTLSKRFMEHINDNESVEEVIREDKVEKVKSVPASLLEDDLAIYVNDTHDLYLDAIVRGLALTNKKECVYIDIEDAKKDKQLLAYLKDSKKKKIGYDVKRTIHLFKQLGIDAIWHEDTMIMASLVDSSLTSSDKILEKYDLHTSMSYEDIYGKANKPILTIDEDAEALRSGQWANNIYKLYDATIEDIHRFEMDDLYYNIEMPLTKILYRMEEEGIRCDENVLDSIAQETFKKIEEETKQIYQYANKEFNINSPKQLGEVLFDDLALPSGKKRSTSAEKLEKLIGIHPIIEHILTYRKLSKLYSTYAEGLKKYIYKDGKIHTIYNQCATQTGRLSSSEPNLQNISVRDEQARGIRKAFLPEEGCVLISSDYHQIELRMLADMANEKSLIDAFNQGIDIHTQTAMDVFHKKAEEVTAEDRRKAKTVNFGIVYGISDFGLATQLGVSRFEAADFINEYYRAYPGIQTYMNSVVEFCEKNGYVETISKRRREIPEIHDKNYAIREFGKRAAMNAPIQGSAADLIKIAMIHIDEMMEKKKVKSKMILQVHDELIFNVPEDEIDLMKDLINEGMVHAMTLKVPLTAECAIGKTWYEAK